MKAIRLTGIIIGAISLAMAWYYYGVLLSVIIFLAIFGNNLEQIDNKK